MRKLLTCLFVIAAFTCTSAMETSADSASIKADTVVIAELVQKQIVEARLRDSLRAAEPAVIRKAEVLSVPQVKTEMKEEESKNYFVFLNGISTKLLILVLFSFVMFLWVASRRTVIYLKKRDKNQLKRNIMMLREEKVPQKFSRPKRKVLKIAPGTDKLNERVLARKAKELSITQGELLLAARIKNFESGNR